MRAAARRSASATRRCSCCAPATSALPSIYKAHKWFVTRGDLDYTALWILYAATPLAQIEVIGARLLADREVIPQALKLNPAFFKTIYTDLLNAKKTREERAGGARRGRRATWPSARRRCSRRCSTTCARPARRGRASEIEDHFKRNFDVERRDHGVRVPGRPGADRQGVDAGPPDEEEQRRGAGAGVLLHRVSRRMAAKAPRAEAPNDAGPRRARRSPCRARASTTSRTSRSRSRATASIVVTGLSGSGKSSLAFDTIYAEGQRRYMESLSSYAKRFVAQVAKPDVDFVFGLSPVISIEQKTLDQQPALDRRHDDRHRQLPEPAVRDDRRSRTARAPASRRRAASSSQILEAILSLPEGAEIELRAPVFKVYGEELDFVFTEVRKKGCRRLIIDGKPVDISDEVELDESTVAAHGRRRRSLRRQPEAREGDQGGHRRARCWSATGCCRSTSSKARARRRPSGSTAALCSPTHHFVYGDIAPEYFMFNNPESACRTCGGLGVDKLTHPELLVPDPKRSILGGCFVREAFKYNPDTWDGRVMYSLSKALGFSLDTPWKELPETVAQRDPLRHRPEEDRADVAARREGQARRLGRQGGRLRRHRAAHRALLPPLPAARRSQLEDGSVARQGDGRAHLPRLQRRARARDAAAVHRSAARRSTTSASSTSTSCTRSSARSSRPAAAPTPAGRC